MLPEPIPVTARRLLSMATAYRMSQLVYVAAKLGLADMLADRPLTCSELATSLGAHEDSLRRVLRGLVAYGVFEQLEDGRFANTELSRPLQSGAVGSVRPGVIYWGQEQYRAWADLLHTVMTGEEAFRKAFGEPFDYYDQHPETGEAFDSFMTMASSQVAVGIANSYEFPERGILVDVAGGEGLLLAAILKGNPGLSGILLERSQVVEKARRRLEAEGVLERCRVVAGDCRRSVPRGGDVYILRNVLHDWNDSVALEILTACRRAMKQSARLVVIQRALPDTLSLDAFGRSVVEADLMQLVYNGGRERTATEYRTLMESAGLRLHQTMATSGHVWLMEARRA